MHTIRRKTHSTMLTTDLALRFDPAYEKSRDAFWNIRNSLPMRLHARGSS